MIRLLNKEIKLSSSLLSFLFIAFGLMFFIPGYPVLCGAFFVTLGIFQSFQNSRETNDIVYSALLPVAKSDVVKAKYIFCGFIELCSFVLMAVITFIRMTVLAGSSVYRSNALMNANLFALGTVLVIFGIFNCVFVRGFFRTGYKFGRPFVAHIIVTFVVIFAAESLHHIPGFEGFNAFGFDEMPLQLCCLAGGIVLWLAMTLLSYRRACTDFENIDL